MKNTVKIDHIKRTITMDRTFTINASNPETPEFRKLQTYIAMFPEYTLKRKEIKKNTSKETYPGLNYGYMRDYIITHLDKEEAKAKLEEFEEQLYLSKCHKSKYPAIKSWFLAEFPEVKEYGMPKSEKVEAANNKVVEMSKATEASSNENEMPLAG